MKQTNLSFLKNAVHRLQHPWPRGLSAQLLLLFSLMLAGSMAAFSYRLLQEEEGNLISSMKSQANVLANNIAAPTANFLLERNYTEIEHVLMRSIDFPGVIAIQVCDAQGKLIGDVRRNQDDSAKAYYGEPPLQVPVETIASTQLSLNKMVVWQPILLGELLGWTKVTYSLQKITDAEKRFWLTNAIVGSCIILFAIGVLLLLMRRSMRALGQYTQFAEKLDELHGAKVQVDHHSNELQQLGVALNNASMRLDEQDKTVNNAMSELEQLATFPEDSPDIVLSMDADAKITYMNPHGQLTLAQLGVGPDEISILLPRDYQSIVKRCLNNNTTARAIEIEYQNRTLLWTFAPLQRQSIIHCYAHEITEKKIAEEYARDAFLKKQSAEMANQAKSTFLANMSHEIRTPLNGVMGFLKLLSKSTLTATQRDYLNTVELSANFLLTVINDILDFSKIEANKITIESVEIEFKSLLEEVISLHVANAEDKGLELIIIFSRKIPTQLLGDPTRITQVLSNLIGNAIKFSRHGEILIQANLIEETNENILIEISVQDSGIGISEETQRSLFQRFNQADVSTTRKHGGTGLGLVIAKTLVELMGGNLTLKSELGTGAKFIFTLRLSKQTAASSISTPDSAIANLRILTISPNPLVARALSENLLSWGIHTSNADNAIAAINKLKDSPYSALIFDQSCVDITPQELATQLSKSTKNTSTPIIFLVTTSTQQKIENNLTCKINGFVHKPVRSTELRKELSRIFGSENNIEPQPISPQPQLLAQPNDKKLRILIVDDNQINQKLAKILIDQLGGESDLAGDGAHALLAIIENTYDLILMDIHMPIMDGVEATHRIRDMERKKGRHTPIIALTADALIGDREEYIAAGMDEYLSKPIIENELVRILFKLGLMADSSESGTQSLNESIPEDKDSHAQIPAIDPQSGIQLAFGNRATWRTVLEMLFDDLPTYLTHLIAAKNDLVNLKSVAHKLAGASSYCGTPALHQEAKRVEVLAKSGDAIASSQALEALIFQINLLLSLKINGSIPDGENPIYASTY